MPTPDKSKTPLPETLSKLKQRREQMQQQMRQLTQYFEQKQLSPSTYYPQYQQLSLQLFQVNTEIYHLDPEDDAFLHRAIQF